MRSPTEDAKTGTLLIYSILRSAVIGVMKVGSPQTRVPRATANTRAHICVNCPENKDLKKSRLTRFNNRLAAIFTFARRTPYDRDLRDCGVCGCPLYEKVHYADDVIRKTTTNVTPEDFPQSFIGLKDKQKHECWVKLILEEEEK